LNNKKTKEARMKNDIWTPEFMAELEIDELKRLREELKENESQHAKSCEGLSSLETPFGPADGSGDWSGYQEKRQRLHQLEKEYPDV